MTSPSPVYPPAAGRPHGSVLAVLVLLAGLVVAETFLLWPQWRDSPDLSHGFFEPLIFVLLVWESRRQGPLRWLPAGRWPRVIQGASVGLGIGAFALAGLFAASVGWTHALVLQILTVSLACFLFTGLLLLADIRVRVLPFNWIALTAIFLWLLVTPLPNGTYARVTLALQGWVTGNVMHTLHLLGIPARQHGNVIELARSSVGVEEACSGIRSLLSCVYAGFFFAAWQVRRPAGRVALIALAPLLALGMNFLRSLTLTLLTNGGVSIAGFWHNATGFAILGVTAVLLALLAVLLESKHLPAPVPAVPFASALPRGALPVLAAGLGVVGLLAVFYFVNTRPAGREGFVAPPLADLLPAQADGWQVDTAKDLYQFTDILQTTTLLERTYLKEDEAGRVVQLTVYVAYWKPGQTSVSRVAMHTPDACWPGAGWNALPNPAARQTLPLPGLNLASGEHRRFANAQGLVQNVWFWHIYDGRVIDYEDPYSVPALLQIALKYGFRRQGEQYFVRVSSNRDWSELAGLPLVHQIFANLSTVGL